MDKAIENQLKIKAIRRKLNSGELTYEEAKAEAQPVIDAIYEKHKEIAKKYGKKASRLSFASLMRI